VDVRTSLLAAVLVIGTSLAPTPTARGVVGAGCHGRPATMVGTDHRDRLVGTSGPDVIVGGRGWDRIDGRGGDDVICGGPGRDMLWGGAGDDRLYGGTDGVVQYESPGGERYRVSDGDDLAGGPGDDYLDPGWDVRQTDSSDGYDLVRFGGRHGVSLRLAPPGASSVAVGEGRDVVMGQLLVRLFGSPGPDHLVGTPGNDSIYGAGGGDLILGLDGDDDLAAGLNPAGADQPDHLVGGQGSDVLYGNSRSDLLEGGGGVDGLYAPRDGATLLAGVGNDFLDIGYVGRACVDAVGGPGRDQINLMPVGSARKRAYVDMAGGPIGSCGSLTSVEKLFLNGDNRTTWVVNGTDRADQVTTNRGDRLVARMRGGDDRVFGGGFRDWVDAGPGQDRVRGYRGTDTCLRTEKAIECEVRHE
jgi:Ca2+-binding RTX toxin-like protein